MSEMGALGQERRTRRARSARRARPGPTPLLKVAITQGVQREFVRALRSSVAPTPYHASAASSNRDLAVNHVTLFETDSRQPQFT